jgi:excisionase family DNA binding protein
MRFNRWPNTNLRRFHLVGWDWRLPGIFHAFGYRPEDPVMSMVDGPETPFAPRIGRSVSIDHAAQLLKVSRRTVYNRIADGRLRTVRTMNGSQRVLLESIIELHELLTQSRSRRVSDALTPFPPAVPEKPRPTQKQAVSLRIVD